MVAIALATTLLGFTMMVVPLAGIGLRRDWMGYTGLGVAAAGVVALIYFG